jgi:hypothetical protein
MPPKKQPEAEVIEQQAIDTPDIQPNQPPEQAAQIKWNKVPELSDDEMTVEAANIHTYQQFVMLLRYRVNGELTNLITTIEGMQHKPNGKTPFVTR